MHAAPDGGVPGPSGDRNDGHHSIVSELVLLIEQVQAGLKQLDAAIARESASGSQDTAGNVYVLDDVTPRYVKASAALDTCNAGLGAALRCLLDVRATRHEARDFTASDHRPARLTNRA
ncbi:MAG: hypothetical protein ABIL01_04740 [Pseudomonadota bacterium]